MVQCNERFIPNQYKYIDVDQLIQNFDFFPADQPT